MEANGIVLSPDPRLRQECAVIEEITPAIEALAEKMKKMMFDNGGCGLAAPQIGELIQLVTIDCDYSDKNDYDPYVLINPVIVEQSDHLVPFSEGCLSIPGISCEIDRPDHVVVEAYDLDCQPDSLRGLGRPILRVSAARDRSPARQHHVRAP